MIVDGKYRILGSIGEGGMGVVYRAVQLNLGRLVAMKVLLPELANNELSRARFEREAKVAASLRHPVAVEIYDVGAQDKLVYIAMELLAGQPLRDEMIDGIPLPVGRSVEVMLPLSEVLTAAHSMGLVHRDVKPENIFIEHNGAVRVLDFGLAFIEGADDLGRLTRDGLVVGTPAYLSPEQAQGEPVGPPSDVYALGCVMYELVTGWAPFLGSWMNVLTQHLYVAPVPARERAPEAGIPSDLEDLIGRMMLKRPEDRPAMEEVGVALEQVQGTLAGERHRGRDDRLLGERAQRMVSVPLKTQAVIAPDAQLAHGDAEVIAAFVGRLTDQIVMALASNGIRVEAFDPARGESPQADVLIATTSDLHLIGKCVEFGPPVVVLADTSDMEQISQLLRLGVYDVVPQPVRIAELTRKVRRAYTRRTRSAPRKS